MKVHELFYYDETSPTSVRWKITPSKRIKAGHQAGSLQFRPDGTKRSVVINYAGGSICTHRVVWILFNGDIPEGYIVDHLNGNPWDNKISNLELKTLSGNSRNRRLSKNNQLGISGVILCKTKTGEAIKASVRFDSGVRYSKSFSVQKYGFDLAVSLAKSWRTKKIEELNQLGAGYTERHIKGE